MINKYTIICHLDKKTTNTFQKLMNEMSVKYQNDRALRFSPHFTLRSNFKLTNQNLSLLNKDLKNYFANTSSDIDLIYEGYELSSWGALFLNLKVTDSLYNLHKDVMNIIEKYREPWVNPELLSNPAFKGKQREYLEKYGYHFSFEFFHPHVTLLGAKVDPKYFNEIKEEIKNWKFDYKSNTNSVAIYEDTKEITKVIEFST